MGNKKIYHTPSEVNADLDEVVVDGPDGVDVSLTPEAAVETATRLMAAAAEAKGRALIDQGRQKTTHKSLKGKAV